MCGEVFTKAMAPIEPALADAKVKRDQIDEIIVVGGSGRVPEIQERLRGLFNGKVLNRSLPPDEAIAWGATVQAGILSGKNLRAVQDVVLLDITPFSLGTDVRRGGKLETSVIIPRNTAIPISKKATYHTAKNG